MLTIIHGSDIVTSRKFFLDQKQKLTDSLLMEESYVNLTDLTQLFEGGRLFVETKQIFIEGFLSKRKKGVEKETIIKYLLEQGKAHEIWLWEGKELERASLPRVETQSNAPLQIKDFKLPSTLFVFLDALRPGNGKQLIRLFHQTLETTESEMVFFMLVRQFRILLALVEPGEMIIDEARRVAVWQKTKLEKQAKLFGTEGLKKHYATLFQIEVGQKTGILASPLTAAIDFFLLEV